MEVEIKSLGQNSGRCTIGHNNWGRYTIIKILAVLRCIAARSRHYFVAAAHSDRYFSEAASSGFLFLFLYIFFAYFTPCFHEPIENAL